jgi:hypothetical protein
MPPPPGLFFGGMPLRLFPVSVTPEASHLEGRCNRIVRHRHHLPPGFSDRHACAYDER